MTVSSKITLVIQKVLWIPASMQSVHRGSTLLLTTCCVRRLVLEYDVAYLVDWLMVKVPAYVVGFTILPQHLGYTKSWGGEFDVAWRDMVCFNGFRDVDA